MKFRAFRNGKMLDELSLTGSYLFGTDGIAIRKSQIKFRNGTVECSKPNLETAGLTLLWLIDGFGKVLLQDTLEQPTRA